MADATTSEKRLVDDQIKFLEVLGELQDLALSQSNHPDHSLRTFSIESLQRDAAILCGSYISSSSALQTSTSHDNDRSLHQLVQELAEQQERLRNDPVQADKRHELQLNAQIRYLQEKVTRASLSGTSPAAATVDKSGGRSEQGKSCLRLGPFDDTSMFTSLPLQTSTLLEDLTLTKTTMATTLQSSSRTIMNCRQDHSQHLPMM